MRRLVTVLALAAAAAGAAWLAASGAGAADAGPAHPLPLLGTTDPEADLMGAAPAGAPGEVWAYRKLPRAVGPPVFGGRPLEFGPAPATGSVPPQLAFLRHTAATGWQVVETPRDRAGNPWRGPDPNRRSARITPHGGGLLVGRAARADEPVAVLVRPLRDGGRFQEVPAAPLQPGETLAEDRGAGRVAAAAFEEGDEVHALLGVLGGASEDAVMHYDGAGWTREPLQVTGAFEILAVDAVAGDQAWLLGRDAGGAPVLLQRTTTAGARQWVPRPLVTPVAGIAPLGGSADPLTVTDDGLWVDGVLPAGGDVTLYRAHGGGGAVTSWCDGGACDRPLGNAFSREQGYVSIGFSGGGPYGGRVITNVHPPGAGEADNRGTYAVLREDRFERRPGGGASYRPTAAFSGPDDGWLEGPVRIGAEAPPPQRLAAWPVAVRAPFTAAVSAPGAARGAVDSAALAVGQDGAVARHVTGKGWTREFLLTASGAVARPLLRGVAWPEPGRAHAVGDLGSMWMWRAETGLWERDPASPVGFEGNLMGVAFEPGDPQRGYAVGKEGTLLSYDKTWTPQTLPAGLEGRDLTSLAFAGRQALVAAGGDLLVNDGGEWRADAGVRALFASLPGGEPEFVTVAGLPDGGAVAAGRDVVIERDGAGAPWRFAAQPLLGVTPVALAAFREGGALRALAAVQPQLDYPVRDVDVEHDPNSPPPLIPPFPLAADGYLVRETATGWRDEQRTAFGGSGSDRPLKVDPVGALLVDDAGEGWALGGWSGEADAAGRGTASRSTQGRADRTRVQTGAIYRYATGTQPARPVAATTAEPPLPPGPVRFAVAGHAACETPCADLRDLALGPDRMLQAALDAVAGLRARPAGPRALLYTGGRLATGALNGSEADRYAELLGAGPPVYPALSAADAAGGASAFAAAFAGFPAPLGSGPAPAGITSGGIPGAPAGVGARTHYAFDSDGSGGRVRVVVIDNAAGSLAESDGHQNPPEPQLPWLRAVLADAREDGIAAIVIGSRDLNTSFRPRLNVASDGAEVARVLVQEGASAYFFERPEETRSYPIPSGAAQTIPSFGTGALGYRPPLTNVRSDQPDALFAEGSLLLAEVDVARRDPLTNRAPVDVRLLPIVSDLTLQAVDGTLLRRSRVALFQGLGRRPQGGDRWGPVTGGSDPQPPGGDPYTQLPPAPCTAAGCQTRVPLEYEFSSSDPDIGDFVAQDPASTNLRKPLLGADDKVITDPRSSLFCPFNAGTTTITVRAGGLSYSTPVTVLAGSVQRPCGTRPLRPDRFDQTPPAARPGTPPPPAPAPAPATSLPPPVPPPPPRPPRPEPRPRVPLPLPLPLDTLPPQPPEPRGAVPAPPLPPAGAFARPIPPGGAVVRVLEEKREEEAAPEQSQAAVAYRHGDYAPSGPLLYGLVLIAALAGATLRVGLRRRERGIAAAFVRVPPSLPHRRSRP